METSAVQRTPNEIWAMILRRVVVTPLFPFMDDQEDYLHADIIEHIQLFPNGCDVYRQTIVAEKAWKILRRVCRSWDSIVSNFHQGCIFAHEKGIRYPAVDKRVLEGLERIQIVFDTGKGSCTCGKTPCFVKDHKYSPLKGQEPRLHDFGDEKLKQLFRHIRTMTISDWKIDRKWLIHSMPKLQALNIYHPHRNWSAPVEPLITLLPDHCNLTHLQLDNVSWNQLYMHFSTKRPFLQSLHYLALAFAEKAYGEPNIEEQKIEWNSPKLKKLVIRGYINFNEKETFALFLQNCGKTVAEYVVTCSFLGHKYIVPHIIHFPHLSVYGASLSYLFSHMSSSSETSDVSSSTTTSLHTLIIFEFYDVRRFGPEEFAVKLASFVEFWGFKEIKLDSIPPLAWLSKFLDQTWSMNLKLFDLKGVLLQEILEVTRSSQSYATRETLALRM
jgi:hypothetical protein